MKRIALVILLCGIFVQVNAERIYVFDRPSAFNEFLTAASLQQLPDAWAKEHGGRRLTQGEKWYAPVNYYVEYSHDYSLTYFFPSSYENVEKDLSQLRSRVTAIPFFNALYQKQRIKISYVWAEIGKPFNWGETSLGVIITHTDKDPGIEQQQKADALKRLIADADYKINGSAGDAYRAMRYAYENYLKNDVFTSEESAALFNKLQEKYGNSAATDDNFESPRDLFRTMVSDTEKKGMAISQGKDPNSSAMKSFYNGFENGNANDVAEDGTGTSSKNGTIGQGKDPNSSAMKSFDNGLENGDANSVAEDGTGTSSKNGTIGQGKDPNSSAMRSFNNGLENGDANNVAEDGTGTSSKNGIMGSFPVRVPFPKWVAVVVQSVAKYLGIEELGKRILMVAYIIAPGAFDYVASFLAKVQEAMFSRTLNEFLDKVAEIYQHLDKFLRYVEQIYSLLQDPDFRNLIKKFDLKKLNPEEIVRIGNDAGLIPDKYFQQIKNYLPTGLSADKIRQIILKNARIIAAKYADKELNKLKIPVSFSTLNDCLERGDKNCASKWLKDQTVNIIADKVPVLRNYKQALNYLANGEYQKAAESAAITELAHITRIPENSWHNMYSALYSKNYRAFITASMRAGLAKTGVCPSLAPGILQKIQSGEIKDTRTLAEVAACILETAGKQNAAQRVQNGANALLQWADEIRNAGSIEGWLKQQVTQTKNRLEAGLRELNMNKQQVAGFINGRSADALKSYISALMQSKLQLSEAAVNEILNSGNIMEAMEIEIAKRNDIKKNQAENIKEKIRLWLEYLHSLAGRQRV